MKQPNKSIRSSEGKATNSVQRNPKKVNTDLFRRNLQEKKEWQDILKAMKRKNQQTMITVPSKDLIQILRRNLKLYR